MEEVFLDIAERSNASFRLGTVVVPAVSAMRSPEVARDMLSLGTLSMNITAPGLFDKIEVTDGARLVAILFDYAMEVAPRVDGEDNVIDVPALSQHVEYMRETFGDIEISPEMLARIGQFAQVRINLEKLAARPEPETRGETA